MEDRLLVLNRDDDCVSVVDPAAGETVAEVSTDFGPRTIETSPDGAKSYVTCSQGNALNVIDNTTFTVTGRVDHDLFDGPRGLVVRDRANELWVVSEHNSRVFVFDIETDTLVDIVPTHQSQSNSISLDSEESTAYVTNSSGNTLTIIDCEERRITVDVPVGDGPEGVGVNPATDNVYVTVQRECRLSVHDPVRYETIYETGLGESPMGIVFAPDGAIALVANRLSNDVSVIETRFHRGGTGRPWEVERIPVGIWPGGIVFDPEGSTAYVANNKSNDVSVIDPETREAVDRIDVGTFPDGLTYLSR
ncbi:YncE family protein [Halohasta salina]|uniref:YncE family protein n=1 Tax=Halohasta salina TaxID=2961621 RepID=UPI0020A48B73|nr:YncE family protein [Halohasta salina]